MKKIVVKKWLDGKFQEVKSYSVDGVQQIRHHADGLEIVLNGYIKLYDKQSVIEFEDEQLPNGEDYGIDSLYHAASILEKTFGEVDGYQSDDGILEHKCAIEAVKRLYKQKPAWGEEDERMLNDMMEECVDLADTPSIPAMVVYENGKVVKVKTGF